MRILNLIAIGFLLSAPAHAEKLIFAEGVAGTTEAATDAATVALEDLCKAQSKSLESYDFAFDSCAAGTCKVVMSGTCDAPEALVYGKFGGELAGDFDHAVAAAKRGAMRNALAQCQGPIVGATEVINSFTCEPTSDNTGHTCRAFTVVRCH